MKHRHIQAALVLILAGASAPGAMAQALYSSAVTNSQGQLVVTRADGAAVVLAPVFDVELGAQQVEFRDVAIAPDRRSVGWVAWFTNGSSPYPRRLELYSDGRRRAIADRVPVSKWCFAKEGSQLAFLREQLHGEPHPTYYLVDTSTGVHVSTFSPEDSEQQVPEWVRTLRQRK